MKDYADLAYQMGLEEAFQECLDIVNRAADYLSAHPESILDKLDILARIITDIQNAGNRT